MKTLAALTVTLLSFTAASSFAQDGDTLALACHVVLRSQNVSPTNVTHTSTGTTVEINFNSGAEGGEPNGVLCEFESADAAIPKLTRFVSDTKRGTESPLYLESGQDAIDQYFNELSSFGSVMAPVEISPVASVTDEPAEDQSAEVADETAEEAAEGEDYISGEADKMFWCSHAFAQVALMSGEAGGANAQPIVDQYNGFAEELQTRGTEMLDAEGFDISDLTEFNASYDAEIQAQFVEGTEEPLYTQDDCEALVAPFTPAQPLP